jgi:hypothetical protein
MRQDSFDWATSKYRGRTLLAPDYAVPMGRLRAYAKTFARAHGEVSSDDVRRWAEQHGIEMPSNAWGSLFRGLEWQHVRWQQSRKRTNNARRIQVWRLLE